MTYKSLHGNLPSYRRNVFYNHSTVYFNCLTSRTLISLIINCNQVKYKRIGNETVKVPVCAYVTDVYSKQNWANQDPCGTPPCRVS